MLLYIFAMHLLQYFAIGNAGELWAGKYIQLFAQIDQINSNQSSFELQCVKPDLRLGVSAILVVDLVIWLLSWSIVLSFVFANNDTFQVLQRILLCRDNMIGMNQSCS